MAKNLTLIFNHFEREHLGKDVFLVPYTIGKKYGLDVTIVYPLTDTNADFPSELRGVKLNPIMANRQFKMLPIWRTLPFYWYLVRNAKKIDVLMRFHHVPHTYYQTFVYKLFNKKGSIYVKLDGLNNSLRLNLGHTTKLKWWQRKKFNFLVKKVDLFSIETSQDYNYMVNCGNNSFIAKLKFFPNGFDEEEFSMRNIKEKKFSEKENLIITVGRLGTRPKNTELILNALDGANLKDWKVELIGTVEDSLKPKIEEFYRKNPDKKDKVTFTGPIYSKDELWSHYNRAKVFMLSSNWESYALVFGEAKRFGCFILTTEVGASKDITECGKYGKVLNIGDCEGMRRGVEDIIDGKIDIDVYKSLDKNSLSWNKLIENLEIDKLICSHE